MSGAPLATIMIVIAAVAGLSIMLGLVLLAAFCVIETKVPEPMFQMRLFRIRAFTAGNLASLLNTARPDIAGTVHQAGRLATSLNANAASLNTQLQEMPGQYRRLNREGLYGSFFNFYLCGVELRLTGPTGAPVSTPMFNSEVQRCQG